MVKILQVKKNNLLDIAKFVQQNTNLNFDRSKKIVSCKWINTIKNYGFFLREKKKIVGYLGCLYSYRLINNKKIIFGNMTNWIVLKQYRQHSIKLLSKLMKQKNCILTNFTANKKVSKVLQLFGFKNLDNKEITFNLFSLIFLNFLNFNTKILETKQINDLNVKYKKIINDHKEFKTISLMLKSKKKKVFCFFLKRPSGRLGNVKLMYSSDYNFLNKRLPYILFFFIKKFKIFSLSIDNRFLKKKFFLVKESFKNKSFFYKKPINKKEIDLLYSEFFGMYG